MNEKPKYQIKLYLSVFVFFWALFALSNSGADNSEGIEHYWLAEHIINNGRLGYEASKGDLYYVSPNGRFYVPHEIGNTAFMLPTAFINILLEKLFHNFVNPKFLFRIKQFVVSFQPVFYSAITATTFFTILKISFNRQIIISFFSTLILVCTTFFWSYSRNLFDGVLCSTLLTLSLFFLLCYKSARNWHSLVLTFICLGFSLITRLSLVLAVVSSITYLLLLHRSSLASGVRAVLIAGGTLLPFCLWQAWYNSLRTGIFYRSPVQTPQYVNNNGLDGNLFVGLTGLFISPGKSLFIYAPLLILSIILFRKFYKEYRKEAIYILVLTTLWLLLHAKLRSWYGAWGWGPRHFITILPILFLPFAVNLEYVQQKLALKISTVVLASFGFILSLSSIISNWHFRMAYAREQNLLSDQLFVWSFWNSQSLDMIKAAVGNLVRIFTHAPMITIATEYSELNEYASSTINVWYNSFIYSGIPWYFVVLLVIPLLLLMYWSLRNILNFQSWEMNSKLIKEL